jgi:hypothetical protein
MNLIRENIHSDSRAGLFGAAAFVACLLVLPLLADTATAARVAGLYGAVVEIPRGAVQPKADSFDEALSIVLVKVTGQPDAGSPAVRRSLFPNASAIVQQFSVLDDGFARIDFDAKAVRNALDRAGMPVWGEDRPLVAVWLAVDAGGGQRRIVSGGEAQSDDEVDQLGQIVTAAAADAGLPVVVPLVDANDLARVSFSDLWGDFRTPVVEASRRYGAEAVLIGRTRSLNPEAQGVRWTLVTGSEQAAWQGDIWSGPGETAVYLARRQATFANSAGRLRLMVTGVDSLDKYGQLMAYLKELGIVETVSVGHLAADNVEFDLVVRGDANRFAQTLDNGRRLVRGQQPTALGDVRPLPDLVYRWPDGS